MENSNITDDRYARYEELADRFMQGGLSPEEESAFKKDIKADPELRKHILALGLMCKGIHEVGRERDKAVLGGNQYYAEASSVPAEPIHIPSITSAIYRWVAAAVVLACVSIGGFKYYQYDRTMDLYAEYYAVSDDIVPSRGMEDEVGKQLFDLFASIGTGRGLDKTILELERCYAESQKDEYTSYTNYSNEIAWYLVLAYLKDNDRAKAIPVLERLVADNTGNAMGTKAGELLKRVADI